MTISHSHLKKKSIYSNYFSQHLIDFFLKITCRINFKLTKILKKTITHKKWTFLDVL